MKTSRFAIPEKEAGACLGRPRRHRAPGQGCPHHITRPALAWSSARRARTSSHLKADLRKIMGVQVHVNIEEIRKPEIDAQLIADSIAQQLEKRIMFRRAMKRAMQNAMRLGAQGIKIMSSGRLNGARNCTHASGIAKAACRFIRCVRTSITALPRRRPPTASSASRSGCTREKHGAQRAAGLSRRQARRLKIPTQEGAQSPPARPAAKATTSRVSKARRCQERGRRKPAAPSRPKQPEAAPADDKPKRPVKRVRKAKARCRNRRRRQ
jgi:small subunit ribosomal protein S3